MLEIDWISNQSLNLLIPSLFLLEFIWAFLRSLIWDILYLNDFMNFIQILKNYFRNTARKFFSEPAKVAKILDVPEELITGIAEIWETLKSDHMINSTDFGEMCDEWMAKYKKSSIKWYKLSPSIHKVLKHGKDVIDHFPIPIGWLSEEPSGIIWPLAISNFNYRPG